MQAFVCNNEGVPVSDTMLTLQISNQQAKAGVSRGCLGPVELGKRLLLYSKEGDTEEVKNLISRGAPFTTDWLGVSPLHLAAQMGHTETAEILLRGGISRDARTKVDRTPLHIAAQEGHTGIVSLLLEHGADVDSEDMLRMTPLHWAVERGHMEIVIKLLENGANPNAVSKFDKTPILIAIDQNRVDLLDALQNNTAYCMPKDQGGEHFLSQLDEADSAAEHLAVELASSQNIVHQEEEVSTSHGTNVYDQKGHSIKINYLNSSEKAKPRKTATSGVGTSNAHNNIQLLRAHGITMIPADDSNLVASAMESGQTVVLTEAGRLALNLTRTASGSKNVSASSSKLQQRKVVTISAEQLAALTGKITKVIPVHKKQPVASSVVQKNIDSKDGNSSRVITTTTGKRVFPSSGTSTDNVKSPELVLVPESDIVKETCGKSEQSTSKDEDLESMAKKLAQAKKEAEQYRQQLLKKEQEAEEYMKKLQSLSK